MRVLFLVAEAGPTSFPAELAGALRKDGLDVVVLAARRPSPATVWRAVRRFRPHVVHVHHTTSAVVGAAVGRAAGVPVVKTEHRARTALRPPVRAVTSLALALADRVVCNSEATRSTFSPLERRMAGPSVVHNGVDVERVRTAGSAPERVGSPAIGTVGRLIPEKGHLELVRAMAMILEKEPGAVLHLVGDGPVRGRIEAEVARLGLGDAVRLLGPLPRDDVYGLLRALDVFVMASHTEGFCNAAVEAMAAGVPVVATAAGALPEVVGEAGVLVPPGDPRALGEAVLRVLAEPGTAAQLREAGPARAARFDLARCAAAYRSIYEELAGG